jgi:hypothetical protein
MKTKQKFLCGIAIIAIAAVATINVSMNSQSTKHLSSVSLENIEALADEEYTSGIPGTNWKGYTVTCSVTTGSSYVLHLGPLGSYGWSSGSSSTATFQGTKCGYGTGWCIWGEC